MEAIEPRTSWIHDFPYEFEHEFAQGYIDILLSKPKDPK